jgi:hypothetical protein
VCVSRYSWRGLIPEVRLHSQIFVPLVVGSLSSVDYDISYDHLVGWEADRRLLAERVAGALFTRPEPRAAFADLVRGLLADVPRKNSWQLAVRHEVA